MPGPIAKRTEERRRRNVVPGETTIRVDGEVIPPELPKRGVNAIARQWYESLKGSGQAQFYEPSDWALAVVAAVALSKALGKSGSAAMLGEAWKLMDSLLTTEVSRGKARLQVQRGSAEGAPEGPTALDEYRKRLAQ